MRFPFPTSHEDSLFFCEHQIDSSIEKKKKGQSEVTRRKCKVDAEAENHCISFVLLKRTENHLSI